MVNLLRLQGACVVALLGLLIGGGSLAHGAKPISGKLSKRGYTVIALPASGKGKAVQARRGKFRITRPAKVVTLHLRTADGIYAGPIVVGREKAGKRAILGVNAGANLGRIEVNARKGYAKVKRRLPKKLIDTSRHARAKKGVPIGAGKFGRVLSRKTKGGAPGDLDVDGVSDPLDIDDDGDRILDSNDRNTGGSSRARASQAASEFHAFTRLTLTLDQTVNANAAALTDAQIDAAVSTYSDLLLTLLPGAKRELDCGDPNTGLVYCRKNGSTGKIAQYPNPPSTWPSFPGCCDDDGDGFGTLTPDPGSGTAPGAPPEGAMTLHHGATTAQIGTGDVLIQRVSDANDVETGAFPSTQQFVFATVPALVSYTDGQGNSATVSYPVPGPNPGPGGPGTRGNGFPVAAPCPTCDVVVTLTYWRPQRTPIPGDAGYGVPGAWTDIGGLVYSPALADLGFRCPQSLISESDPNLLTPSAADRNLPALSNDQGGFIDQAADQSANPANTFTYTVNLTQCLAAKGLSFNSGEERGLELEGIVPTFEGITIQPVFFERV
jgi:hypothetical protein